MRSVYIEAIASVDVLPLKALLLTLAKNVSVNAAPWRRRLDESNMRSTSVSHSDAPLGKAQPCATDAVGSATFIAEASPATETDTSNVFELVCDSAQEMRTHRS